MFSGKDEVKNFRLLRAGSKSSDNFTIEHRSKSAGKSVSVTTSNAGHIVIQLILVGLMESTPSATTRLKRGCKEHSIGA
jgi:hypothetical protein